MFLRWKLRGGPPGLALASFSSTPEAGSRRDPRRYLAAWATFGRTGPSSTRQVSATSTVGRVTSEVDSHKLREQAQEEARRTRGLILEVAVRADYILGEALSSYLGADEDRRLLLTADVMWRVPVELRVKLLQDAMEKHELADIYPFAVPVLQRLFRVRNVLAHSLEVPDPAGDPALAFTSINRGKVTQHSYSMECLEWLHKQSNEVTSEVWLVGGALMDLETSAT